MHLLHIENKLHLSQFVLKMFGTFV